MTETLRITAAPGEEQRPNRGPKAVEADVDLENFILISHAVPAARVRAQLPERIALETFEDEDGSETCFVTTACFCNRDLRPRLTGRPTHTFNQVTFRTYVTYGEARGLYFFGTYCDTIASFLWQGSMATGTKLARFEYDMAKDGRGYSRYSCTSRSGPEEASWVAEATDEPAAIHPFASAYEHVQFLGYRLHGFSRNPFGFYTHGRVDHRKLRPFSGRLLEGRFDLWTRLGILQPGEYLSPRSVLIEPHIRFTLMPPRPVRL
ncbi:MAG TPA: DUF2071 domain-containing protein [Actinomycetota bacterium]|nr:DUF2071 domain-containing protein [Actinomycetota bacterium]